MEQNKIIEGNKLIAEFMGWRFHPETANHGRLDNSWEYKPHYYHFKLEFHTSWDWLMPVVEKILSLNVVQEFQIREVQILREKIEFRLMVVNRFELWLAIVEFIKWYNESSFEAFQDARDVEKALDDYLEKKYPGCKGVYLEGTTEEIMEFAKFYAQRCGVELEPKSDCEHDLEFKKVGISGKVLKCKKCGWIPK